MPVRAWQCVSSWMILNENEGVVFSCCCSLFCFVDFFSVRGFVFFFLSILVIIMSEALYSFLNLFGIWF